MLHTPLEGRESFFSLLTLSLYHNQLKLLVGTLITDIVLNILITSSIH